MPKLICLSGMNKGEEYELIEGENSIGRNEKNNVCVFDKKVSRVHCKVHVNKDGIALEDLNSTNGTRINNVFMTGTRQLKTGDHIRVGQTVFLLSERSVKQDTDSFSPLSQEDDEKYEKLLDETAFHVTKTTALRKQKTIKDGRPAGFLSFFEREEREEKD